jgi:hypothetical protein
MPFTYILYSKKINKYYIGAEAKKREAAIKKMKSRKYIEALFS